MKGISELPLIALIIVSISIGYLLLTGTVQLPLAAGLEEAVFCNLYEFQSCVLQKSATVTNTGSYICRADECRITCVTSGTTIIRTNQSYNILCSGSYTVELWNRQLLWTGSSGSTIGVPVAGSDRCTYVTDKSIYDPNGNLIRSPTQAEQSYTVPEGQAQIIVRNEQFICGTKFNQCTQNTDCTAGHTFTYRDVPTGQLLGAEASAGQLQIYGCVQTSQQPTQSQKDILPSESQSPTQFNYGNRCQATRTQIVQCIPGQISCGANSVCDVNTFTCKATGEVQCAQDRDCGIGETYDLATKSYYKFACVASQCQRQLVRTVECAFASECPVNWYCDIDGTCKESTQPKQACPSACCESDARYFDRPPPPENVCCPGGESFAPSLDQCQPQGDKCGFLGLGCLFGGFGDFFGGLFGALAFIGWIILIVIILVILFFAYKIISLVKG